MAEPRPPVRPFALVHSPDQWRRAAHEGTFLDPVAGVVELGWVEPAAAQPTGPVPAAAGLAFDAECRLYRSVPAAGTVERSRSTALDPLAPSTEPPQPLDLFEAQPRPLGEFSVAEPVGGGLREPRGLAVDADDRLYIAETGAARVLVFDLWSRRLLRRIRFPHGAQPLDLAVHGRTVYGVVRPQPSSGGATGGTASAAPARLYRMSARVGPLAIVLPDEVESPSRIAISPDGCTAVLLEGAGSPSARLFVFALRGDRKSVV